MILLCISLYISIHKKILYIVHNGTIPALCSILTVSDPKIITVALEGLENILKAGMERPGEINDRILEIFSDCGGIDKLEELQDHAVSH